MFGPCDSPAVDVQRQPDLIRPVQLDELPALRPDSVRLGRPDVSRRPRRDAGPPVVVAQSDAVGAGRRQVHAVDERARSYPGGQEQAVAAEVEVAEAGVVLAAERRVLAGAVEPQRAAHLAALVDVRTTEDTDVKAAIYHSVTDDCIHRDVVLGRPT